MKIITVIIMCTIIIETFISKYVFSMDHKMIAKQFLIQVLFGRLLVDLSVLFRLHWLPDSTFPWLENILGHWARW